MFLKRASVCLRIGPNNNFEGFCMKIISWNINKKSSQEVLSHLENQKADIYLLQEVTNSFQQQLHQLAIDGTLIWANKPQNTNSEGSAILAPRMKLKEINVGKLEGWICLAECETQSGSFLTASIHAPTSTKALRHFQLTGLSCSNWIIECALPILEELTSNYSNAIIGGDTNCAVATGKQLGMKYAQAHQAFSMKFGYEEIFMQKRGEATTKDCEKEVPTYRSKRMPQKALGWYMCNDHFFVRGPILDKISSCFVLYKPEPPSDHAPIELQINL